MKQLGTVIDSGLDSSNTRRSSPTGSAADEDARYRAAAVWRRLTECFGTAFVQQFGDVPPRMWIRAIASLTDEQIARGLDAIAKSDRPFPPNLSQFVGACRPSSPRYLGVPETPLDIERRISAPKANPEHAAACIARSRQAIAASIAARPFAGTHKPRERERAPDDLELPSNPLLGVGCSCNSAGTCPCCQAWRDRMGLVERDRR